MGYQERRKRMNQVNRPPQNVHLLAREDVQRGFFCNSTFVSQNNEAFCVEMYSFSPPSVADAGFLVMQARAFLTPAEAKRMVAAIQKTIDDFEKRNGTIETDTTSRLELPDQVG
jgi:Protein of unknown function (DUF3467)